MANGDENFLKTIATTWAESKRYLAKLFMNKL